MKDMMYICICRIPKEILHNVPTTLLHSLEGMGGLDWEKLLKLQSTDGSFLFSPSSTAYALMQTRDQRCFHFLQKAVDRFNGGGAYLMTRLAPSTLITDKKRVPFFPFNSNNETKRNATLGGRLCI